MDIFNSRILQHYNNLYHMAMSTITSLALKKLFCLARGTVTHNGEIQYQGRSSSKPLKHCRMTPEARYSSTWLPTISTFIMGRVETLTDNVELIAKWKYLVQKLKRSTLQQSRFDIFLIILPIPASLCI